MDRDKNDSKNIKPPLGLMPKKMAQEERFLEVCSAISRYYEAKHEIPIKWIEEYNELVEAIYS